MYLYFDKYILSLWEYTNQFLLNTKFAYYFRSRSKTSVLLDFHRGRCIKIIQVQKLIFYWQSKQIRLNSRLENVFPKPKTSLSHSLYLKFCSLINFTSFFSTEKETLYTPLLTYFHPPPPLKCRLFSVVFPYKWAASC